MSEVIPAPATTPAIAILEGGPFAGRQFVWRGWTRLIVESFKLVATYDMARFDETGRALFTLKEVHDRNEKAQA